MQKTLLIIRHDASGWRNATIVAAGAVAAEKRSHIVNKLNTARPEILLYNDIYDDPNCESALQFAQDISSLALRGNDVTIRINSNGGNVSQGWGMISSIENVKRTGKKVNIIIDGIAASMAAILAMTGSRVVMKSYARLMFHEPSAYSSGNSAELRSVADEMDNIKESFATILAKRTGLTTDQVKEKYLKQGVDTYLTAQEALEQKLIDAVEEDITMKLPDSISNCKDLYTFYSSRYSIAAVIQSQQTSTMNKELLKKLGLAEGATQEQIDAAVEKQLSEKATLETNASNAAKAQVTALLDDAVKLKKITAAQKTEFEAEFGHNVKALKMALDIMQPAQKPTDVIAQATPSVETGAAGAAAAAQPATLVGKAKFEAMYAQGVDALEKWRKEDFADYSACYKQKYGRTPEQMSQRKD